jgi:hypothetical protein
LETVSGSKPPTHIDKAEDEVLVKATGEEVAGAVVRDIMAGTTAFVGIITTALVMAAISMAPP